MEIGTIAYIVFGLCLFAYGMYYKKKNKTKKQN